MKQNKLLVLGLVSLFILSFMTIPTSASTSATPGTPQPGDTLIYAITTWNVPDILNIESEGAVTSDLNMVGSELGLKILSADEEGYEFALYVKAGAGPISITVNSTELDPEAIDVLSSFLTESGDLVVALPANTAFPIVTDSWNSFNLSEIDGPPFWIKNVDWVEVENFLASEPGVSYSEEGDTVTIEITENDIAIALTYTKSATDAVFTELAFSGTLTDSFNTTHPFNVVLSYVETLSNPLPTDFAVGDIYVYKFSEADLSIDYNLNKKAEDYINYLLQSSEGGINNIESAISLVESLVTNIKETTAFQYEIKSIDGVLYEAEITGEFSDSPFPYTDEFNGFMLTGPGGLSPAVTPDWELWDGVFIGAGAIADFAVGLYDVDTVGSTLKQAYTDLGVTSGPNIDVEVSSSLENGIKYHTVVSHSDVKWDSTKLDATALEITNPEDIPPMKLSTTSDNSFAIAHTEEGYFLSLGLKSVQQIDFDIDLSSLGTAGTAGTNQVAPPIPTEIVGSLKIELSLKITLSDLSLLSSQSVEDELVNQAIEAEENVDEVLAEANPIQTSPGFELPIMLFTLIAVPVFIRKIRK
ncbi:MAG: hypothetical protein HeimC3_48720 [Candidatus Heimdallarchaeota archaeon LC_3]|nr:MAG: hypothetical protein HeimC3_48720 [Candidatus Heimdallarchaeota archaeon LC_3]